MSDREPRPLVVDWACTLTQMQELLDEAKAQGVNFDEAVLIVDEEITELQVYEPLQRLRALQVIQPTQAQIDAAYPAVDPDLLDLPTHPIEGEAREQ
jgi:hypothetical protein